MFGERFEYNNPTFLTLQRLIDEVMCLLGSPALHLFNFYPFLGFLFTVHKTLLQKIEEVRVIIRDYIKSSRQDLNGNSFRSYTEALVFKQQQDTNKRQNLFHEDNLIASILDLVMAGTETTATTLQWAVLLAMRYPEMQSELMFSVDVVVSTLLLCLGVRVVCSSLDSSQVTPCSVAEKNERHRIGSCSDLLLPVLQGTMVIPSLTSVLLDQSQWETPHEFNPNHFLDPSGNFVKKDAFVPYSLGNLLGVFELWGL
ncbi:hypothetical protein Chor_015268 [Crotalus horridus]